MDCKAQVSFEYLLTITFGIILVIAAFAIALQASLIGEQLKVRILNYREKIIASLLG